jgi:hypothetical protein
VGPAVVLEEEIPFPLELSDVDKPDVLFVVSCITGCGRIVGKDLLPFERLLGLPLPLDHEMCFPSFEAGLPNNVRLPFSVFTLGFTLAFAFGFALV